LDKIEASKQDEAHTVLAGEGASWSRNAREEWWTFAQRCAGAACRCRTQELLQKETENEG